MIILWGQSEDAKRSAFEFCCFVGVCWAEKTLHVEIFPFNPYFCGAGDFVEDDAATIGGRDSDRRIIRRRTWTSLWFEFTEEELVESIVSENIEGVTS